MCSYPCRCTGGHGVGIEQEKQHELENLKCSIGEELHQVSGGVRVLPVGASGYRWSL